MLQPLYKALGSWIKTSLAKLSNTLTSIEGLTLKMNFFTTESVSSLRTIHIFMMKQ